MKLVMNRTGSRYFVVVVFRPYILITIIFPYKFGQY